MKKLLQKYFYVPEDGYVSDLILMNRIACSVCIILLCLGAMGLSAFAYFSSGVSSSTNTIAAAGYDITVEITPDGGNVSFMNSKGGIYTEELVKGTYTIKLTKTGQASTGYCRITVANAEYITQQIGVDMSSPSGETHTISFTLVLRGNATVTFTPCWGTSSYYSTMVADDSEADNYILNGETITDVGEVVPESPVTSTQPTEPVTQPTELTTEPAEPATEPTEPNESGEETGEETSGEVGEETGDATGGETSGETVEA